MICFSLYNLVAKIKTLGDNCDKAEQLGYPCKLREIYKYCGINKKDVRTSNNVNYMFHIELLIINFLKK